MKKTLWLVVLSLAACTSSNFTKTGFETKTRPPLPDNCAVTVLESMPTDRPYEELGFCSASAPGGGVISDKTPDAIAELKRCTCRNGGNAVVFKSSDERGMQSLFGHSQQKVMVRGTVLFVPPAGTAAPAPR
ncbi:MAG: hypothetical protein QOK37_2551 [Thermoanaerobaculia bacterium]|jgi:hypothetical protein|nr:hypothetical protein [Thermoanaerobaculia bacterium]